MLTERIPEPFGKGGFLPGGRLFVKSPLGRRKSLLYRTVPRAAPVPFGTAKGGFIPPPRPCCRGIPPPKTRRPQTEPGYSAVLTKSWPYGQLFLFFLFHGEHIGDFRSLVFIQHKAQKDISVVKEHKRIVLRQTFGDGLLEQLLDNVPIRQKNPLVR